MFSNSSKKFKNSSKEFKKIFRGLSALKQYTKLDTEKNRTRLIQHAQYANEIAAVLSELERGAGLITQANYTLLIQHAQHADRIACVLFELAFARLNTQAKERARNNSNNSILY